MSQRNVSQFSKSSTSSLAPLEECDNESSSHADPISPRKPSSASIPGKPSSAPRQITSAGLDLPLSEGSGSSPDSSIGLETEPKEVSSTQQPQQQPQASIGTISIGSISNSITNSSNDANKPRISLFGDLRRSNAGKKGRSGIESKDSTSSGKSKIPSLNEAFKRSSDIFGSAIRDERLSSGLLSPKSSGTSGSGSFDSPSNRSMLENLNTDNTFNKRSSLARKNKTALLYKSRMAAAHIYRGYSINDYALVMNHVDSPAPSPNNNDTSPSKDLERNASKNAMLCLVNKFGYPKGKGNTQSERAGPYAYVLCTIQKAHYEENEVYWTIIREDNGEEMRGDARHMAPISSDEGLLAAQEATFVSRVMAEDYEKSGGVDEHRGKDGLLGCFSNCLCLTCCLPVFCLFECVGSIKKSRGYKNLLRHAKMFLNGGEPYKISFRITSVKVFVLCSTWYLFIDQIRLAFIPPSYDDTLARINFVVWLILVMELLLGFFVRPEGWISLVRSEKAYTPETAQYINGVHLFVESISLVFFVPVFYCIFTSTEEESTCSDRISFSFLEASLVAVLGPSAASAFYGRFFYGIIRFRVFALVRHWRNAWLKNVFLNDKKYAIRERRRRAFLYGNDEMSTSTMDTLEENQLEQYEKQHDVPYGESSYSRNQNLRQKTIILEERQAKNRSESRVKAANIGTALMTVHSHRALFLFCFLTACFPTLFLINIQNVVNPASEEMVEYLQAINIQVPSNDANLNSSNDCDYLFDSVEAWSKAQVQFNTSQLISTNRQDQEAQTTKESSIQLISVTIHPPRCYANFNNRTIGNLVFLVDNAGGNCPPWSWHGKYISKGCIFGTVFNLTNSGHSLQDISESLGVRVGAMKTFEAYSQRPTNSTFAVSATYNHTHVVRFGALYSFILELLLLITVFGMLLVLRKDTVDVVFGSLRSMLRIILRYAKNPLTPSGGAEIRRNEGQTRINTASGSSFDSIEDGDNDDDEQLVQTYETEQLVTAVSKITDLLRKCWGVAGADIISTNLASREGDLEVFNPTVPGRNVFALFAFAAITDFDHALQNLDGDVMILINDVASVLHGEVYRWGLGDSGQCNRNLGAAFFMVFKIGSVLEVVEKLEEATQVVFSTTTGKKISKKATKGRIKATAAMTTGQQRRTNMKGLTTDLHAGKDVAMEAMAEAMQLSLDQIPGISAFADRAVIGMLKAFASIHRDTQLRAWSKDFRLSDPSGDPEKRWSVDMIFGMDAGWAIEGAVGSEYKIDATYLSPHVNMSSRMMSACKQYGVTILLSEAVHKLLSEPGKSKMRNLDRVTVKGSSKVQNIYTYDARANGSYLFLYGVSDEQADQQAKNYEPSIWHLDMDLKDMRHHITEDFELEFEAGMKAYYDGDWPTAIAKLERANDIMVETAMEEGDLQDSMTAASPEREAFYRSQTSDPPSMFLINFMKSKGGVAPRNWEGWHPLMSK